MTTTFSADAMTAHLEELVTCESPSSDLDAVRRSAATTADLGAAILGEKPERIVLDGCTHLRWRFGAGTDVLLLGHHDTVWPVGSLIEHPWRTEDGIAYGPGCFDMKAGLVQLFHAVASQADPSGISILISGDEELGAPTSQGLIEDEARRVGATLVLEASADGGALKTARKGVSLYEVVVHGRAAHAGLEPWSGVNAGIELAHQIHAIAALDEGAHGATVTPTVAAAGTTTNTVPARGSVHVDARVPTLAVRDDIDRAMRGLLPRHRDVKLEIRGGPRHPPLEPAMSSALYDLAEDIRASQGLPPLGQASVGGASDGNLTAGVGTLTLDGLGAVGGSAHAPGEHVILAEMPPRTQLLAGVVASLQRGWSPATNPARSSQRN